ncbi:MAG: hypothetical protein ABIJ96_04545 [Elusimicrobiota bacterium]
MIGAKKIFSLCVSILLSTPAQGAGIAVVGQAAKGGSAAAAAGAAGSVTTLATFNAGLSPLQAGLSLRGTLRGAAAPSLGAINSGQVSVLPSMTETRFTVLDLPRTLPAAAFSGSAAQHKEPLQRQIQQALKKKTPLGLIYDGVRSHKGEIGDDVVAAFGASRYLTELPSLESANSFLSGVDRLYAELAGIHAVEKDPGASSQSRLALPARKRAFIQRLEALDGGVPGTVEADNFAAISKELKTLHAGRAAHYRRMRAAAGDREELNAEAIRINLTLLKTQLRTVRLLLSEDSPLPSKVFRRNAALWTLAGAYNSAAMLKAELRYRGTLAQSRRKARESFEVDAAGAIVRIFDLPGFAMELHGSGKSERVVIRQQRWRSLAKGLSDAALHARNGRIDQSIEKLTQLAALDAAFSARIAQVRARVESLMAPNPPPAKEVSAEILAVRDGIVSPLYPNWKGVEYENLSTALRSQAHTLAANADESARILRAVADLERASDLLNSAVESGVRPHARPLAKEEFDDIGAVIQDLRSWAARGKVAQKQSAAGHLQSAAAGQARGDYAAARRDIARAIAGLNARLQTIERISAGVRRRAAAVYTEYRDQDILRRTALVVKVLRGGYISRKAEADLRGELSGLLQTYFSEELPEPGYARAKKLLKLASSEIKRKRIQNAIATLQLAREDIRHKTSYRTTIRVRREKDSRSSAEVSYRYYVNGTSLQTLLKRMKKEGPFSHLRLNGEDWLPYDRAPLDLRLHEDLVLDLVLRKS